MRSYYPKQYGLTRTHHHPIATSYLPLHKYPNNFLSMINEYQDIVLFKLHVHIREAQFLYRLHTQISLLGHPKRAWYNNCPIGLFIAIHGTNIHHKMDCFACTTGIFLDGYHTNNRILL
jgi:hypothetical protein